MTVPVLTCAILLSFVSGESVVHIIAHKVSEIATKIHSNRWVPGIKHILGKVEPDLIWEKK